MLKFLGTTFADKYVLLENRSRITVNSLHARVRDKAPGRPLLKHLRIEIKSKRIAYLSGSKRRLLSYV